MQLSLIYMGENLSSTFYNKSSWGRMGWNVAK